MMLPKFKIRRLSSKYNALLNNLNFLLYLCSCIVITLVIAIQFLKIIAIQNQLYRDITSRQGGLPANPAPIRTLLCGRQGGLPANPAAIRTVLCGRQGGLPANPAPIRTLLCGRQGGLPAKPAPIRTLLCGRQGGLPANPAPVRT